MRERPPLLQLLRQLASRPPLVELLDALPPLAPRWYSLASSPLASPGRAHLCVSIAAYTATDAAGTRHLRRGVASHFLERTAAPLLKAGGAEEAAAAVPVFWREPSGHELRLPPSPATPVIVIGPGTGLAPFRAFLQHRRFAHARKRSGPRHVRFGCPRAAPFHASSREQARAVCGLFRLPFPRRRFSVRRGARADARGGRTPLAHRPAGERVSRAGALLRRGQSRCAPPFRARPPPPRRATGAACA